MKLCLCLKYHSLFIDTEEDEQYGMSTDQRSPGQPAREFLVKWPEMYWSTGQSNSGQVASKDLIKWREMSSQEDKAYSDRKLSEG